MGMCSITIRLDHFTYFKFCCLWNNVFETWKEYSLVWPRTSRLQMRGMVVGKGRKPPPDRVYDFSIIQSPTITAQSNLGGIVSLTWLCFLYRQYRRWYTVNK